MHSGCRALCIAFVLFLFRSAFRELVNCFCLRPGTQVHCQHYSVPGRGCTECKLCRCWPMRRESSASSSPLCWPVLSPVPLPCVPPIPLCACAVLCVLCCLVGWPASHREGPEAPSFAGKIVLHTKCGCPKGGDITSLSREGTSTQSVSTPVPNTHNCLADVEPPPTKLCTFAEQSVSRHFHARAYAPWALAPLLQLQSTPLQHTVNFGAGACRPRSAATAGLSTSRSPKIPSTTARGCSLGNVHDAFYGGMMSQSNVCAIVSSSI